MWKDICEAQYISLLESATNTRDLGGYQTEPGQRTRAFSMLRSSCPVNASADDISFLKEHGITTVIDLRTEAEMRKQKSGLADIEGLHYFHCPITEGSEIPASVEAVPVSYMEIADAVEMPKVFRRIAEAPEGVIFHCSAGKDRTGVVAAILLLHTGVEQLDIIFDYVLSKEYNRSRMEELFKRMPEIKEIVTPREGYMEHFLELFQEKYADTMHYFEELGLTEEEMVSIRGKLI